MTQQSLLSCTDCSNNDNNNKSSLTKREQSVSQCFFFSLSNLENSLCENRKCLLNILWMFYLRPLGGVKRLNQHKADFHFKPLNCNVTGMCSVAEKVYVGLKNCSSQSLLEGWMKHSRGKLTNYTLISIWQAKMLWNITGFLHHTS